jgi:hypothetical protein
MTPEACNDPSEADIRAAVARLTASTALRGAPRLVAFLRYVVDHALTCPRPRHPLKGYTIAVEALGRHPDFDPVSDPIVRVEATRLRRALARYYAGEGRADPVRIDLPVGGYRPVFHRQPVAPLRQGGEEPQRTLALMLEEMIESRRMQIRAMLVEMRFARQSLRRYRDEAQPSLACPPPVRLLPPAPSHHHATRPADGRQEQQAEGAFAARPRRSRAG